MDEDEFFDAIEETLDKMENLEEKLQNLEVEVKKPDTSSDKKDHRMYNQVRFNAIYYFLIYKIKSTKFGSCTEMVPISQVLGVTRQKLHC